jgi:small subunit ribosomal protein S9
MIVTDMQNRLDVNILVAGGGITGQSGAICQGLARAIKTMYSGAGEQRSYQFGNVTVVRSRKVQAVPGANPAPSTDSAPADEAAGGMVKKLRDSGYLTRDSRMKERKKYGLRGARRGTQFSKR